MRWKLLLELMSVVLVYVSHLRGQAGDPDPTFNGPTNMNGEVYAIAVQNDGKIVIGGSFTEVDGLVRNWVARLHSDGLLDQDFNMGSGYGGVLELAIQPDGKVLVGGLIDRGGVVRVNLDGSLDPTFNVPVFIHVFALVYHPSGKIYIAGSNRVLRLNPDGSVDETFSLNIHPVGYSGAHSYVAQFVVQPDARILFCGDFLYVNDQTRASAARLNANGTLDLSFVPDPMATWWATDAIGLRMDGYVYSGRYGGGAKINRIDPAGAWDQSFAQLYAGSLFIDSIGVQSDGKPIIGGNFFDIGGRNVLARFNNDGTIDESFSGYVDGQVEAIVVQPDGRILIGGGFSHVNGQRHAGIARLLGDAPVLGRQRVGSDKLVVSWPAAYTNHLLQSVTSLNFTNWSNVTNPPFSANDQFFVTNSLTGTQGFFRLMNP